MGGGGGDAAALTPSPWRCGAAGSHPAHPRPPLGSLAGPAAHPIFILISPTCSPGTPSCACIPPPQPPHPPQHRDVDEKMLLIKALGFPEVKADGISAAVSPGELHPYEWCPQITAPLRTPTHVCLHTGSLCARVCEHTRVCTQQGASEHTCGALLHAQVLCVQHQRAHVLCVCECIVHVQCRPACTHVTGVQTCLLHACAHVCC